MSACRTSSSTGCSRPSPTARPSTSTRRLTAAAVVAVATAIGVGIVWTQVVESGDSRPIAWTDVTSRMGPVLWPRSVTRSFWTPSQLTRFLDRTFPLGAPPAPRFDFQHERLILVAAGPRSSTGYRVEIARVTDHRSTVIVLAREVTPSLDTRDVARLTSPYRLIAIPATPKRVYVQWKGRP